MDTEITHLATDSLVFDVSNPRLTEFSVAADTPEKDIIRILWDTMDVLELVHSISASGFFGNEPLLVVKKGKKKVVIEGNRRLAAVKILRDPSWGTDRGITIPKAAPEIVENLNELPVIITERSASWKYLGFKHVNGPAKWSSLAKAEYISDVHERYKIPLSHIALQIGDTHKTVQRLHRALMVLRQAEKEGVFDVENRFKPRFAFSHLYTGLGYEGISDFIGLADPVEELYSPVSSDNITQLGELLTWMYGNRKEQILPVVESQNPNLRELNTVLLKKHSISVLRSTGNLSEAFEDSRTKSDVFEEALSRAKIELQRARAHVTQGFDGTDGQLRTAGTIADLAEDLYSEMERKMGRSRRSRLTEE
jgi:hypothetical protein